MYGMRRWRDAFTPRQLTALTTFSDLINETRDRVLADGAEAEYADVVATYLAFALDKCADWCSSICSWITRIEGVRNTFARQAIPMVWDFVEINPFSASVGNFSNHVDWVADGVSAIVGGRGSARQADATTALNGADRPLICTDPPYYDNVGYADLSDFFYVWLRHSLRDVYPDLFTTLLSPKAQELVAAPHRFDGDRTVAETFFEDGLRRAFTRMREAQNADYPLTVFYAFKQAESEDGAVASTGWEKMLTGLLDSGFGVTGTWPMRTERSGRTVSIGTAALASSVVLVCRPRPADAPLATRREFVGALRTELPHALRQLQNGNIAPVDLAQAAIGPGIAIFSRYASVVEADGSRMTVRTALALINQALDEILAAQEGDFDADTRFAVTWFEQRGAAEGPYGEADVLARAKNTSVAGMVEAGVLASRGGKVRLLPRDELPEDWDPLTDRRLTGWEATQHLVRRLELQGEGGAAELLRRLGGDFGEQAKELAYRLYVICERKGWAQEALGYNGLVVAWPEIARQVAGTPEAEAQQQLEV
jgi:putative DNA methylase